VLLTLDADRHETVLDGVIAAGLAGLLDADCGGIGHCGQCRCRVAGPAPAPTAAEGDLLTPQDLADGIRLACQLVPTDALRVELLGPLELRPSKAELAGQLRFDARPAVHKVAVTLARPDLHDQRSDWLRVRQALAGPDDGKAVPSLSLELLRGLPDCLRAQDWRVTGVFHGEQLVAVEPGDTTRRLLVAAVDIGTTTLAVYLLDLAAGRQLAVAAGANPQAAFGADVISRISAVIDSPAALGELQRLVAGGIQRLLSDAARRAGVDAADVYEIAVVGNACMLQLLAGVDPRHLAASPYVPGFNELVVVPASELGLSSFNPAARACLLPGIGGYVGADIVADILVTRLHRLPGTRLLIDVGTNGEMALAHNGRVVTCATAAGPAFEGAHIECGMRAAAGAIDHVSLDGEFRASVIGSAVPAGLCGSGLLDAVAAMVRAGVVERSGRLRPATDLAAALSERLVNRDGSTAFVLAGEPGGPVYVSQRDVRQLQMAKGAMRAGINILLKECGLAYHNLDEVLLAGAFGSYLSPESALAIGLLPPVPRRTIRAVGNAAGEGARLAAFSLPARDEAVEISRRSEYVELSVRKDFQEVFIKEIAFPDPT